MSLKQVRLLHGVIFKKFMEELGIEVNKENMGVVKKLFKRHLSVEHTSSLDDKEYSVFIDSVLETMANGWGVELPGRQADTSMADFLKMVYSYDERKLAEEYDNKKDNHET